ncbi:hypothetical protein [Paenibacillus lemnae]|uniref:Uncharacterized protein n=1 Tax=Paenibacillus lemnae TaxID=1330551 RepID=A0A848M782_PAELE|nr:hypothetical protein [Paenibacillus lemnae]NMO96837.1 hypothetical protein [Paenibacillus lemnae]
MNRVMKTMMSLLMAVAAIFNVLPIAAATQNNSTPTPESGIIKPYAQGSPNKDVLVVYGNPSAIVPAFSIPAHYGWVKVWVKNNGKDTITVTVTKGTETGVVKMQFKVAPGQQGYKLASSPWAMGNHVVSISPGQGYPVKAQLNVKLAGVKTKL